MTMLQRFHTVIAQYLEEQTRLQKVTCYPSGRSAVETPAGFLELAQISMGAGGASGTGSAPSTEELALQLTWTLRILVDSTSENVALENAALENAALEKAPIVLQSLLIEAAQALYLTHFGLPLTPVVGLDFQMETMPDAEAFVMGSVTWTQECLVGDSVWDPGEWIPPTTLHIDWKGGRNAG